MFNLFSSQETPLKNVEAIFLAIAASTSGKVIKGEGDDSKHPRLECKINGMEFSSVVGELETFENLKIKAGRYGDGKSIPGLNVSCPLNTGIDLRIFQAFYKPAFKNGMENVKSHNPEFDGRYYILTKDAASIRRLIANKPFQDAVKSVLDKHQAIAIKERRLIVAQALKAVDKDAGKMKALMVSMAKFAAVLNNTLGCNGAITRTACA